MRLSTCQKLMREACAACLILVTPEDAYFLLISSAQVGKCECLRVVTTCRA